MAQKALLKNLVRFEAGGAVFLTATAPRTDGTSAAEVMATALAGAERTPDILYWDGRAEDKDVVHLGRGGLDPFLAATLDLTGCVAIEEKTLGRALQRGAIKKAEELPNTIRLLARSPGVATLWCEGLTGAFDPRGPAQEEPAKPGAVADALTVALLIEDPEVDLGPFFTALKRQVVTASLELVAVSHGLDTVALKRVARSLEAGAAADGRLKFRRYSLVGPVGRAYLANTAVALASTEAIVIADPRCLPVSPNLVQRLADWSISGDVVASCPQLVFDSRLAAAGLAVRKTAEGAEELAPWSASLLSGTVRTVAAPAPGMFAVRRNAWLASGGLRGDAEPALWPAELAAAHSLKGRAVLDGAEIAEWTAPPPWLGQASPVVQTMQVCATAALRDPPADGGRVERVSLPSRRPGSGDAGASRLGLSAYSDPFPSTAPTRLLVFADGFGASQSIAFVEGLTGARRRGGVAVRIFDEAAFQSDSRTLDQPSADAAIEAEFEAAQPTVAVVSRLGHAALWTAVHAAARRRGVPILVHIDDDLLSLPVVLGVERYRLARNPRRAAVLRAALAGADLVMAATPALADRLRAFIDHDRIVALETGCAGRPASRQPRTSDSILIGYMGSASHNHDLAIAAPALSAVAASYPHVEIVLFGSIADQAVADQISGRVQRHAPVNGDYSAFKRRLADLRIDIGLAPLSPIEFNRCKTPTKWVEYAEAGAAVIASPFGPYAPLVEAGVAEGAGLHQWEAALRRLIEKRDLRRTLTERADALLSTRFGWDRLEAQVLGALERIRPTARAEAQ